MCHSNMCTQCWALSTRLIYSYWEPCSATNGFSVRWALFVLVGKGFGSLFFTDTSQQHHPVLGQLRYLRREHAHLYARPKICRTCVFHSQRHHRKKELTKKANFHNLCYNFDGFFTHYLFLYCNVCSVTRHYFILQQL